MTKEKRIEIKENRKNVKQNNQGSNYERGIICTGFERVIYNGKEYVDKSPLFLDSTCPLSQAYHQLASKKANRAKLMEETMRKKRK